jgi:hypothetical protein
MSIPMKFTGSRAMTPAEILRAAVLLNSGLVLADTIRYSAEQRVPGLDGFDENGGTNYDAAERKDEICASVYPGVSVHFIAGGKRAGRDNRRRE